MRLRVICTLLVLLSLVPYSLSQVATGVLPFNRYGGGPFDTVNLGNLNVHFTVPVLHKAGRGTPFAYDLNYDSSIYQPVVSNGTTSWQPSSKAGSFGSYWGWQNLALYIPYVNYTTAVTSSGTCYNNQQWYVLGYSNYVYYDALGTPHPFPGVGGAQMMSPGGFGCPPPSTSGQTTGTASDGSGYSISFGVVGASTGNVSTSNGTTFSVPFLTSPPLGPSPFSSMDHNGNKITFNNSNGTFTDTLGQAVLVETGTAPNPLNFSYIPPANESTGTRVSVTVNFKNYTVQTNFNATDGNGHAIAEYRSTPAVALVDNITLPDGTKYQFQYEATPSTPSNGICTPLSGTTCTTGRILKVTLPTGGTITYGYTGGVSGANGIFNDGSTAGLTRQLSSPGGNWSYSRSQVSGNYWTTTMISPTLDNTVINFTEDSTTNSSTTIATYSFYETQRQIYQGSISSNACSATVTTNCLLLTSFTCWNGTISPSCGSTAITSPINEKSVTTQYPNSGQQTKTDSFYNGGSTGSGLVSEIDQYAYSTGTPTTLLRKTLIQYGSYTSSGGGACFPRSSTPSVPCIVSVLDGSGNILSDTHYTYDENTPQATTGTPQHVNFNTGNPTTISTALSTPNGQNGAFGSSLTTHFSYYDTGNVYQSQDANGQSTTYNYSTAAQGNTTKSCGNSFPTSYTLPITGLSSSASTIYDCIGGVVTSATDINGNTTTTSFTADPYFWRPASMTDPTSATTGFTYTSTSVDSRMVFNGTSSVAEQLTTLGTFGQVLYSQQREGPSSTNYDSTQVLYDSFLRANQFTMPCVATVGQGCPSAAKTTSTFDALGRVIQTTDGGNPTPGWVKYTYTQNDLLQEVGPAPPGENTKQKQLEYDALGRLISVCEKTNGPGSGVCSQTTSQPNGFLTSYAYGITTINSQLYTTVTVTQNAQASSGHQTRVYTYDIVGRLISEQNPEHNNLTKTYTYDSDSSGTCSGTYTGDLIKLTDTKGNNICYQYDALHRMTQISYPSGPDSANTPTKVFVYDAATYNGTAMSNAKGQIAEAYTGSSSSRKTDEFFSYSVRRELTDTWECTPHSGTTQCNGGTGGYYYHVTAGFWANGGLSSLSSNISGIPTQTYAVDPMGRTSMVSASSGQNPVTGTSYNLSTFTYGVTFGSQDSDQYTMDPYTGRMTQYKSNVGSQSLTGNLTWNPNGSLATQAISDTIPNTHDSQTCNYTHDDLSRISSANCGSSIWNQQFSYDAFGNITKTVPMGSTGIAFQPTYSSSTNWMTALSGITPTYDNNGQLTYDGTHNYTWDAEGKMLTVDTTTLTHDALGRMVEKAVSSTYTQIVYGPMGNKFALMNGQSTLVKGYVPLPGAQAVYTSTGLTYYRHRDHLGSSRLATTPTRTMYSSTAYAPYGESYGQGGATDLSFTGQDQDTVSGIYDFMFRKYNPVHGRWLSTDPAGSGAVDPSNPQTWNRYAYVMNNPMSLVDPLGLYCDWGESGYDDDPADGGASQGECTSQGGTWVDGPSPGNPDAGTIPVVLGPDGNPIVPGESVTATSDPIEAEASFLDAQLQVGTLDQIGALDAMLPGIEKGVDSVLQNKNPCSDWLNAATEKASDGLMDSAAALFDRTKIKAQMMDPGTMAATKQGDLNAPIYVNPFSHFFQGTGTIFGYPAGSMPLQITIMLHELAHKVLAIPADGGDTPAAKKQSIDNTNTVLNHCRTAINGD